MAQPSITNYFATRKRTGVEEANIIRAKKVLILDSDENVSNQNNEETLEKEHVATGEAEISENIEKEIIKEIVISSDKNIVSENEMKFPTRSRVVAKLDFDSSKCAELTHSAKKAIKTRPKHKKLNNQGDIQKIFQNMQNKAEEQKVFSRKNNIQKMNEQTPPSSPVKSAMDKVVVSDLSLNQIKSRLTRSARLAELKERISTFNKTALKLHEAEKKTQSIQSQGPSLDKFKSIELEVTLSPTKIHSPAKPYLSPLKNASPCKNLFGMKSPMKSPHTSPVNVPAYQRFQHLASPGKSTLTLPYHFRHLAELFRSIDTVCSILFNRKEIITFTKVKPAVQEMIRKNLNENHLAQINTIYPEAFSFSREKMRMFASGNRNEHYELVIKPNITSSAENEPTMNPNVLLERRRKLYNILIENVKNFHNEFLITLDPPLFIPADKITRWHPEFDLEKVPEILKSVLPQPPEDIKLKTGQEVLEKARILFNCNTRMERALEKLKKVKEERQQALNKEQTTQTSTEAPSSVTSAPSSVTSVLKGIPQSLLEKVRAKQAAKALEAMTRTSNQDHEALMYSRLPDIARLLRNTYVSERKGVLALEEVIKKLNNSYRTHLNNSEIEQHLRLIAKSVPGWMMFHEVRNKLFVKLSRDGDMKKVMTKLEELAKEKSSL